MNSHVRQLALRLKSLLTGDEGQDLVEYSLLVAMIAFGLAASMSVLSAAVSNVFTHVGAYITNAVV